MAASLRALVSALDDDPYCGTRPPHWPGGPLRAGVDPGHHRDPLQLASS